MGDNKKIIIVKKRKKASHAHHGGSWKVAYADFVTAMMAFFLVMWIMNMDQGARDLVQGYFENPVGFKRSYSGGKNILSQGNSIMNLESRRQLILKRREAEEGRLREVAADIERRLVGSASGTPDQLGVEIVVGDDGLRIEMMEPADGASFFEIASAAPTRELEEVLRVVAAELATLNNGVVVEGHTDAMPFGTEDYSNWELSVDRANAARRILIAGGLSAERLMEVRGYADRRPKFVDEPVDRRNRRVTVLIPFDTPGFNDLEEWGWTDEEASAGEGAPGVES